MPSQPCISTFSWAEPEIEKILEKTGLPRKPRGSLGIRLPILILSIKSMKKYLLLLLFLFLFSPLQPYIYGANSKGRNYNVLVIAVDDLNVWIGPYGGHPQTITPNLDKLARNGVIFTNAQCAAPISNPSRAALMTGIRPSTSGVYNNDQLFRESEVLKKVQTIPQYFAEHGYKTMAKGKIFHHPEGIFADAQSWQNMEKLTGFGMNNHPNKMPNTNANGMSTRTTWQRSLDWGQLGVLDEKETSDYQTVEWAAKQLSSTHDKPFFLACGIFRPHLPWFMPKKYFDRFPLASIILPEVNENDLNDIPRIGQQISGGLDPEGDYFRVKKYKKEKEAVQAYLAAINYADECVGVILNALQKSKYADNTIVVLLGDHGWHLGEKLHYRKSTLWEESSRLPLMIMVPNLTKGGQKCSRPVNLIDLYPTLNELCGLPEKKELEGQSIVPLLMNVNAKWEQPSLTTFGQNRHSLRSERYRFIQYEDGSEELYDHKNDPMEYINLAGDKKYKRIMEEFRIWLPKTNVQGIPPYKKKDFRLIWLQLIMSISALGLLLWMLWKKRNMRRIQ